MNSILITSVLAISVAACSSAQKEEKATTKGTDVPEAVTVSFKKHYSNVSDVDWEKEGSNYEAEFEANDTETSVTLDPSGKILETENEIETSLLPATAMEYLNTNYKGKKVKEATKIVLEDGTIQYEAEVNNKDIMFDANGTFIKENND